ncbi:PrgI family protein [uncultured Clostridium sp.]
MPYVPVPKDLTKVKTKVAFNLTKRQLICFSIAGVVGVPVYFFSRGTIGNSAAALIMIGLMMPFFFFAMYERDGQCCFSRRMRKVCTKNEKFALQASIITL